MAIFSFIWLLVVLYAFTVPLKLAHSSGTTERLYTESPESGGVWNNEDEVDTGSMQSEKIAMSGFDHEEKNDPLFATSVEVNVRGYYSNDKLRAKRMRGKKRKFYVKEQKDIRQYCSEQQKPGSWGLPRLVSNGKIENPKLLPPYRYNYHAGSGVNVYVLDSGIYAQHPDFEGRVIWGADFVNTAVPLKGDPEGHGTHVAGIIMSATYGVAKMATAIDVRISSNDVATAEDVCKKIVGGLKWVKGQHKRGDKSVINMSVIVPYQCMELYDEVDALAMQGAYVISSAGNYGEDACNYSPAGASQSITVTASDMNDAFWSRKEKNEASNFGPCTHIIAPGGRIVSTSFDPKNVSSSRSGTSMAAAFVSGVVANYLSSIPPDEPLPTTPELRKWLQEQAVSDVIQNVPGDTPNKLVHYGCND